MDISPRSTSHVVDDPSWLGSAHGTDATRTITLDTSAFTAATHYPDGFVPSGTALTLIAGTGLYGPAADADAATGCFLYGAVEMRTGGPDVGAAALDHGKVRESRLPQPVSAAFKTGVAGRIQFV